MPLHLNFDRFHQADEHGAVGQFLEGAGLGEEHFKHLHEDLEVEQIDPEASLYYFLIILSLLSVKDALKSDLDRAQTLILQLSQLLQLLFERWNRIRFRDLLLGLAEDLGVEDLSVQVNQFKQKFLDSLLWIDHGLVSDFVQRHEAIFIEVH